MRGRRTGGRLSPLATGLLVLGLLTVGVYMAFWGVPFTGPSYELRAVFENAANVQSRSPVRIAGVEVGKVEKVEARGDEGTGAVVVMKIHDSGLPIHEDAQLRIRPRIFLEGNFFVDLKPGTSSADELDSGDTIGPDQTSGPVQIDQVLTTLQSDPRRDLQELVRGFGDALSGDPAPGEEDTQDEDVHGQTAAESLNDSIADAPEALRGISIVNDALLGTEAHDLSKLVASTQKISSALVAREDEVKDLITNFDSFMGTLASEQDNLRRTIALLPGVLEEADPALDALNASFPPTRAFARDILPGVRETPATIEASTPWIAQTRRLVSPPELQGLVRELRPAVKDLSRVVDDTVNLLPQIDLVSRCLLDVVLPTGDVVIEDPPLTTGIPNYKEFWQALVGLSSESQNFDGNGGYTRFQPGGGSQTVSTGDVGGAGPLFAQTANLPLGTRPARPPRRPPYNREVPCHQNRPPDLNSAKLGAGP